MLLFTSYSDHFFCNRDEFNCHLGVVHFNFIRYKRCIFLSFNVLLFTNILIHPLPPVLPQCSLITTAVSSACPPSRMWTSHPLMYHDKSELEAGAVRRTSILGCRQHCRGTTASNCTWFAEGYCHCLVGFIQRRYTTDTEDLGHLVTHVTYAQRQREYNHSQSCTSIK